MARPDFTDGASAQKWLENEERTRQQPMPRRAQPEFEGIRQQMQGLSPEAQHQVRILQHTGGVQQRLNERLEREDALRAQYEEPQMVISPPTEVGSGISGRRQAVAQAAMQEYDLLMQQLNERRAREDAFRAQYMDGPWPDAGISGRRRRMTRVY